VSVHFKFELHSAVQTTAKIANPEIANAEVFTDIEAAEGK
jgi:hypothetical protein